MSKTSHRVASLSELQAKGRMLVKQVALFHSPKGVYARDNRCPHEGHPLSQGTLAEGCVLTCNWHNWKFDLEIGETMVGGDTQRRYPAHSMGTMSFWVSLIRRVKRASPPRWRKYAKPWTRKSRTA